MPTRIGRRKIIRKIQKIADTKTQKIDATIVSRVVSLTLDEVSKELENLFRRK